MEPIISCEGVTRRFGGRTALDNVTLEVQPGRCFGFLGPNGAGKTTIIRCMLGLARPTSGRIVMRGYDIADAPTQALSRIGAIVEEPRFYGYLTGRQNLALWAALVGAGASERIPALLERVQLVERADDRVAKYSLGMRQRLGVARALLNDPELLVLDEPTNGLDPDGVADFRHLIRSLVEQDGRAVFVSSHLLDEIEKICDDLAIIHQGKVVTSGTLASLIAEGASSLVIETDDAARTTALLSAHHGVRSAIPAADGSIVIDLTSDTPEIRAALNRELVTAGIGVSRLEPSQESLEDRYLSIVHQASVA